MGKQRDFFELPAAVRPTNVVGFYIERPSVEWTGEILNLKTGELVKEPSMTKQSFKDECDINNIVRRFEATGQIDHVNQAAARGLYTDLPSGIDLQASLEIARQAEEGFMALPAHVRAQFDNDPVMFVDFVDRAAQGDEKAQQSLIDWGVASDTRPPPKPPAEPPAGPPAAPGAPADA